MTSQTLAIDRTLTLDINHSRQRVRLRAARAGLPPLLIVQAGPGLSVLHEVRRFERLMDLERDFLVAYWEQRGTGDASREETRQVSMAQQVEDLCSVLRWLHAETHQRAMILGISIGATFALRAAEREPNCVKAIVAVSTDTNTGISDAAADVFLRQAARDTPRIRRRVARLAPPPCSTLAQFQRRTGLLSDLGTIEYGKTFATLARETLIALVRTYGVFGAVRALRNMNTITRHLLPEIASLDLLRNPPRVTVPVHYIFGEQDVLTPEAIVNALAGAIAAPSTTVHRIVHAGHMAHFDQPAVVRSILERA